MGSWVAFIRGIVAMAGFTFGAMPCFGWMNWFNISSATIVAFATANAERQPVVKPVLGLVLCGLAVILGAVRLLLGGGIL